MDNKIAIKYGIYSGLAIQAYHLGVYFWDKEIILHYAFFYGVYLVHLPFMVMAGIAYRKFNEGLIDYKDALSKIFITFLVGMGFYYLTYFLLFNYDDELVSMSKQMIFDHFTAQKESKTMDTADYNRFLEAWNNGDFDVGIGSIIKGLPFRIFGGFALSALAAVMVRR